MLFGAGGVIASSGGGVGSQSLDFDGSTDYLSMSDANFGSYDRAQFALAFSINPDKTTGSQFTYAHRGGAGQYAFILELNGGNLEFRFSQNGSSTNGIFDVSGGFTSGSWQAFLVYYDSANGTSGDRIRVWKNNSELTPSSYGAPTAAVANVSAAMTIGARDGGTGKFDGLIHQPTFFSGTLPSPSDIFDGSSGKLKDLSSVSGAYSHVSASADAVTDSVLATDWTNNGTVTTSSTVP